MRLAPLLIPLCLVALAAALTGCDSGKGTKPLPGQVRLVGMRIGNREFQLEVADSYAARQKGLMYRQSLPADGGMLFAFEQEEVLRFWMKNTYVPLDIIFVDGQGRIVAVRQMRPLDETTISSEKPAKYAIEVNEGAARNAGVKPGDSLTIPPLD